MKKLFNVDFDEPCLARFNSRYQLKIIRILIILIVFMFIVFVWILVILFKNRDSHSEVFYDEIKAAPYKEKHNEILQKNLEPNYDVLEEVEFDMKQNVKPNVLNKRTKEDINKLNGTSCAPSWNFDWDGMPLGLSTVKDRIVILIRSAETDIITKKLTTRGQNQVEATALRLKHLGIKPKQIMSSHSQNTLETTKIIYEHFQNTNLKFSKALNEGLPVQPSPQFNDYSQATDEDLYRMGSFFREYFSRPLENEAENTQEIIILENNILRYFTLKILQLPENALRRMYFSHASITKIHMRYDGTVFSSLLGDNGHLDQYDITY